MTDSSEPIDWSGIPDYFCPSCTALRFGGEPSCAACDSAAPPDGWPPLADSDDPYLGSVLADQYLITKRDPREGQTAVYRAESLDEGETLTVRMHDVGGDGEALDDDLRRALAGDISAAKMLNNPYVAPIHELLELAGGVLAVVTEFVPGATARQRVERDGPFPVDRGVAIACQLADGLADAHLVDLVHGDLRPGNVELAEGPGGRDIAFLFGFGPSGFVPDAEGGAFRGTPAFASPEQRETGRRTIRSDVYGLGATLFYLVAGRPPWEGTPDEMQRAKRAGRVPKLADILETSDVPEELDATIADLLAPDPLERPETAGAVIYALRRCVELPEQMPVEAGEAGDESDASSDGVLLEAEDTIPPPGGGSDEQEEPVGRGPRDSESTGGGFDVLGLDGQQDPNESGAGFLREGSGTSEYEKPPEESQIPLGESLDEEEHPERTHETSRLGPESSVEVESDEDSEAGGEQALPRENAPPGRFLRVATVDGTEYVVSDVTARLWRGEAGGDGWELVRELDEPVVDFALDGEGVWLALGSGTFRYVDLSDGTTELHDPPLASPEISAIAAASEGSLTVAGTQFGALVVGGRDGKWAVPDTAIRRVRACAVSRSGGRIAVADAQGRVGLFEQGSISRLAGELRVDHEIVDLAFDPSGELLAVSQIGGEVTVHSVDERRQVTEFQEEKPPQEIFFEGRLELRVVRLEGRHVRTGRAGTAEREDVMG